MNRRLSGRRAAAIAAAGLLCPFWVAPQAQAEDDEAVIAIEDIFVVGTRRPVRSTADTPAPIDLIAGEDFSDQGATELPTLLRTPSFPPTTCRDNRSTTSLLSCARPICAVSGRTRP